MCTIQKPKKRFDYAAYIQGRLIGKYVVIYHDELPDEPETDASEVEEIQHVAKPFLAIKPDDIPELYKVNVDQGAFHQSYLSIKSAYTGVSNRKGLAVYESDWIFDAKLVFQSSRAGPSLIPHR